MKIKNRFGFIEGECHICRATVEYSTKKPKCCNDCYVRFNDIWDAMKGAKDAHKVVSEAKNRGDIPNLHKTNIDCVDCGGRAEVYDHRDYSYPLFVSPVCRGCNSKRGAAKYLCGDYKQMQRNVYTFFRAWQGPQKVAA